MGQIKDLLEDLFEIDQIIFPDDFDFDYEIEKEAMETDYQYCK